MSKAISADRKATAHEVRARAAAIRRVAGKLDLGAPRLRDDGALVVHSPCPGYRDANRFSAAASEIVGAYVHVITDDVPGAASALEL